VHPTVRFRPPAPPVPTQALLPAHTMLGAELQPAIQGRSSPSSHSRSHSSPDVSPKSGSTRPSVSVSPSRSRSASRSRSPRSFSSGEISRGTSMYQARSQQPPPADLEDWAARDIEKYLVSRKVPRYLARMFRRNGVTGSMLKSGRVDSCFAFLRNVQLTEKILRRLVKAIRRLVEKGGKAGRRKKRPKEAAQHLPRLRAAAVGPLGQGQLQPITLPPRQGSSLGPLVGKSAARGAQAKAASVVLPGLKIVPPVQSAALSQEAASPVSARMSRKAATMRPRSNTDPARTTERQYNWNRQSVSMVAPPILRPPGLRR